MAVLSLLWMACASPPAPAESGGARFLVVEAVGEGGWSSVAPTDDPFGSESADCDPLGVVVEGGALEIDTGLCAAVTLTQPALTEVRRGDRVRFLFTHTALASAEPAQAEVVVGTPDDWWLDLEIAIPAASDIVAVEVAAEVPVARGSAVYLHVSNHGSNNYRFSGFEVE